jgi:hypothetical protein
LDRFLDPGAFDAGRAAASASPRCSSTPRARPVPLGVVLSHQSHIWVVETRLAPDLDRHRYLIAAPLYHMNALALAKLACAAHASCRCRVQARASLRDRVTADLATRCRR